MRCNRLVIAFMAMVGSAIGSGAIAQEPFGKTLAQIESSLAPNELRDRYLAVMDALRSGDYATKMKAALQSDDHLRVDRAIESAAANAGKILLNVNELSTAFRWSLEVNLRAFESLKSALDNSRQITLNTINRVLWASADLSVKVAGVGKGGGDSNRHGSHRKRRHAHQALLDLLRTTRVHRG